FDMNLMVEFYIRQRRKNNVEQQIADVAFLLRSGFRRDISQVGGGHENQVDFGKHHHLLARVASRLKWPEAIKPLAFPRPPVRTVPFDNLVLIGRWKEGFTLWSQALRHPFCRDDLFIIP